jgi:hypothetical protein
MNEFRVMHDSDGYYIVQLIDGAYLQACSKYPSRQALENAFKIFMAAFDKPTLEQE